MQPPMTLAGSPHPVLRQTHGQVLMRQLGEPLLGGNRVQLLADAASAAVAMLRAIDGARDHINLESGRLDADGPEPAWVGRLLARCRDGVKVNLLFDGPVGAAPGLLQRLQQAGVMLCARQPASRWWLRLGLAQPLGHRPLMVVDGRVGFLGSIDLCGAPMTAAAAPDSSGTPASQGDLHLQIDGPVVQRLQRLFVGHWQRHAPRAMHDARYFPPLAPAGTRRVALAASEAAHRDDAFAMALLGAIGAARGSVLLGCAGPWPSRRQRQALALAARRGVQVDLLLPEPHGWSTPQWATRPQQALLQRVGVRLHERCDTLPAQGCVIDGVWSSVGSCSRGWHGRFHPAQAHLIVLDEEFGQQMAQWLRTAIGRARSAGAPPRSRRSFWTRWSDALSRRLDAVP